jgi:hypothetical protein
MFNGRSELVRLRSVWTRSRLRSPQWGLLNQNTATIDLLRGGRPKAEEQVSWFMPHPSPPLCIPYRLWGPQCRMIPWILSAHLRHSVASKTLSIFVASTFGPRPLLARVLLRSVIASGVPATNWAVDRNPRQHRQALGTFEIV